MLHISFRIHQLFNNLRFICQSHTLNIRNLLSIHMWLWLLLHHYLVLLLLVLIRLLPRILLLRHRLRLCLILLRLLRMGVDIDVEHLFGALLDFGLAVAFEEHAFFG